MQDRRDDDALMAATAAGDEQAFRALVERWERRVAAFLYRSLGSGEDALDLAQETFLRLYRAAPAYEPRGRFAPFLFRIAGNLARNEVRRRTVRRFLGLEARDDPGDDPAEPSVPAPERERPDREWERARAAARVRQALLELPERQRVAIVLKRFEGFTQQEIAEAMGVSEASVESLLSRGMAALRKRLGHG
jgi:RNA polymerase sigma-70 factor (ECF subfamily)